jgi:DNA gyrase subunit A
LIFNFSSNRGYSMDRPDLSKVEPQIKAYIEFLEERLRIVSSAPAANRRKENPTQPEPDVISTAPLPAEPPTTIQILTISKAGSVKRTSRHLYSPQHRGGMGVFDLDVSEPDYPHVLASVDESQNLLLFTNLARVFRYPLSKIPAYQVRSKGEPFDRLPFEQDETVISILPEQAQGYIALSSASGRVRILRHHVFGEHMKPGTAVYPYRDFGPLASACWTSGDGELFMITRRGIGIRFSEKLITPQGDWGIKVGNDDAVVGITSIYDNSGVFMIGADGKGTVRLMSGFAPNKSAGGSGKIAFKNDQVIGAAAVTDNDNIFIISRQSKIIRFRADEVPPTEGVVQGVNCMMLRNDSVIAMVKSSLQS